MAVHRPTKPPVAPAKAVAAKAPESPAKTAPAPVKPAAPAKAAAPAPAKPPAAPKPAAKATEAPAVAKTAATPVEIRTEDVKPAAPAPAAAKAAPAKPAEAPVKAIPVAAMDISGVQDNLRKAASKTIEQGRAAFDRMKEASDEATETIEASLAATSKGAAELAARALEVTKVNANATFDHLKALAGAKTLAEAVSMHGQFIRAQSEAAVAQAKEFAELARKAATDAAAPIQAQIKKAQTK